jgi:hypothetical protein
MPPNSSAFLTFLAAARSRVVYANRGGAAPLAEPEVMHKGVAMKATLYGLAAVLLVAATATVGHADPYYWRTYPQAPDACRPGYYCTNYCGAVYGPNYCLRPPFEPWNGFRPNLNQQCGPNMAGFPAHPFARSPRDYFMYGDP